MDPSGNLFVADFGNNRIQKFDATGNWLHNGVLLDLAPGQLIIQQAWQSSILKEMYLSLILANERIQEFTNDGKFVNKWHINTFTGATDNIDLDVNSNGISTH